jgi:hypothetical protein
VLQRRGQDVAAGAEVVDRQFADLVGDREEGVVVGVHLPGRGDRGGERVHERVHVGGGDVVLLVPGGRGEHDIGVQAGVGHPEVDRGEEVELAGGRLVPPPHVAGPLVRPALLGRGEGVHTEQVPHEELVALAG